MSVQFKERKLLSETQILLSENCDDAESGNKSDENSNITSLISKEEMDAMYSCDNYDDEPMSTNMLKECFDGSQSHPGVNSRETGCKIRDCIKHSQSERKGELLSTQTMGKGLHKVFKDVVN